MPRNTSVQRMTNIGISGQSAWYQACGNTTGVYSPTYLLPEGQNAIRSSSVGSDNAKIHGDGRVSKAVAGVIGTMVTLRVVLGLEAHEHVPRWSAAHS